MKFLKLNGKAILAPMAGVTDVAFRELCRKYGASLSYTELINCSAVIMDNEKTKEMLRKSFLEKPSAVQLFGNDVDKIIKAAKIVGNYFDIIDINCGCPVRKIIKTGAGSAMTKDLVKFKDFLKRIVENVNVPVTIKIRTGIDDKNINAIEVAKIAEDCGVSAIAIHGRTQKQKYSGKADWNIIKEVKEAVKIPVIGNGDVNTPEKFKECLEKSKVDYIMIGRGAIGNPYIFTQINDYMKTGKYEKENKKKLFFGYLELSEKYKINFLGIRQHAIYFTKGIYGGVGLRSKLAKCKTINEIGEILNKI